MPDHSKYTPQGRSVSKLSKARVPEPLEIDLLVGYPGDKYTIITRKLEVWTGISSGVRISLPAGERRFCNCGAPAA
jgi:hypothetical protein